MNHLSRLAFPPSTMHFFLVNILLKTETIFSEVVVQEMNDKFVTILPNWSMDMYLPAIYENYDRPTNRPTNRPTDQPTDRPTDKASYRVACPQL